MASVHSTSNSNFNPQRHGSVSSDLTDARPDNWDSYWKDVKKDPNDLFGYLGNVIIASRATLNDSQRVELILHERRLLLVEERKKFNIKSLSREPCRHIYRDIDTNDIEVVEDKRDPRKLRLCFCKMMRTEAQFENPDKKAEWLIMLRHHNSMASPKSTMSTTSSNPPFFHVSGPRQSLPPESPVFAFNEIDSGILVESPTSESPRRRGSLGSTRSEASGHSYFLRELPGTRSPNHREDDASFIANPQRGTDAPDASASPASPVNCCHHADPNPPSSPTYPRNGNHPADKLRINTKFSTQVDENHQPASSDRYDLIRQEVIARARAESACFSFASPTSVHH